MGYKVLIVESVSDHGVRSSLPGAKSGLIKKRGFLVVAWVLCLASYTVQYCGRREGSSISSMVHAAAAAFSLITFDPPSLMLLVFRTLIEATLH